MAGLIAPSGMSLRQTCQQSRADASKCEPTKSSTQNTEPTGVCRGASRTSHDLGNNHPDSSGVVGVARYKGTQMTPALAQDIRADLTALKQQLARMTVALADWVEAVAPAVVDQDAAGIDPTADESKD